MIAAGGSTAIGNGVRRRHQHAIEESGRAANRNLQITLSSVWRAEWDLPACVWFIINDFF